MPITQTIVQPVEIKKSSVAPHALKVVFMGLPGAGKSSLIDRVHNKRFLESKKPSVQESVVLVKSNHENQDVQLQCHAINASKDGSLALEQEHAKSAHAIVFVVDSTNSNVFESAKKYFKSVAASIPPHLPRILIATKSDSLQIDEDKLKEFADAAGVRDFETDTFICSAKDAVNVNESFKTIVRLAVERELLQRSSREQLKQLARLMNETASPESSTQSSAPSISKVNSSKKCYMDNKEFKKIGKNQPKDGLIRFICEHANEPIAPDSGSQLEQIFKDLYRQTTAQLFQVIDPRTKKCRDLHVGDKEDLADDLNNCFPRHVKNFLKFSDQAQLAGGVVKLPLSVLLNTHNLNPQDGDLKQVIFMEKGELFIATVYSDFHLINADNSKDEGILPGSVYTLTKLTGKGYETQCVFWTNSLLEQIYRGNYRGDLLRDLKTAEEEEKNKCFAGFHRSLSVLEKFISANKIKLEQDAKKGDEIASAKLAVFNDILLEVKKSKKEMDEKYNKLLYRMHRMQEEAGGEWKPLFPKDFDQLSAHQETVFLAAINRVCSDKKHQEALGKHRDWLSRWAERIAAIVFFFISVPYYVATGKNLFHISTDLDKIRNEARDYVAQNKTINDVPVKSAGNKVNINNVNTDVAPEEKPAPPAPTLAFS